MRRRPARGAVRAKTGTTDQASALSGYAGRRFAFAVLENGSPVSWAWARTAQDRFATVLAASALS
jgi:D-alanyl-D-alanine carboxypeptidase